MCPFDRSGPGSNLRRTLRVRHWRQIIGALLRGGHFHCHKTTVETGDGSKLVCAGSIEWAAKRGIKADVVQVMERFEEMARRGIFTSRSKEELR